jgi:NitT/TauT family transport system substrate-binding protein
VIGLNLGETMMMSGNISRSWLMIALAITVLMTIISAPVHAQQLRVGILPVVDTLPLMVAQKECDFKREGIDIELVPFQSALERDAALQAGRLDGYFGDLLNTLSLMHAGMKLKVVTTVYMTRKDQRMFGIAASPKSGIENMAQLKGKAVAISRNTVIEYLLDQMLSSQATGTDAVEKQEIKKMPIRMQMLLSDQVPAALLPEPLLTLAESKGARVLMDDRHLDMALTVIALNSSVLTGNTDLSSRFLKAYGAAVEKINANPKGYLSFLMENTRFPKGIEDRFNMPVFPEVGVPGAKDVSDAQNWLKANGTVKAELPYSAVVLLP